MKLHLGCGPNVKEGYVNIDGFVDGANIQKGDILNLNYNDGEVDEILAEHLFEHIPFKDEKRLFEECYRMLKDGGILQIEVPDMEWLCMQFLQSNDVFTDFYKVGEKDHYFGNNKSIEHRWGIITTHFFGNQNGGGQFHYNGYTKNKMIRISELIGFKECQVIKIMSKGAQSLIAKFIK